MRKMIKQYLMNLEKLKRQINFAVIIEILFIEN